MDRYAKAIVGAITASLTAAGAALAVGGGEIPAEGWVAIALAFVANIGMIWGVPNAPNLPSQVPMWIGYEDDEPGNSTTAPFDARG